MVLEPACDCSNAPRICVVGRLGARFLSGTGMSLECVIPINHEWTTCKPFSRVFSVKPLVPRPFVSSGGRRVEHSRQVGVARFPLSSPYCHHPSASGGQRNISRHIPQLGHSKPKPPIQRRKAKESTSWPSTHKEQSPPYFTSYIYTISGFSFMNNNKKAAWRSGSAPGS